MTRISGFSRKSSISVTIDPNRSNFFRRRFRDRLRADRRVPVRALISPTALHSRSFTFQRVPDTSIAVDRASGHSSTHVAANLHNFPTIGKPHAPPTVELGDVSEHDHLVHNDPDSAAFRPARLDNGQTSLQRCPLTSQDDSCRQSGWRGSGTPLTRSGTLLCDHHRRDHSCCR